MRANVKTLWMIVRAPSASIMAAGGRGMRGERGWGRG